MKPDDKPKSLENTFEEPKLFKEINGKKFSLPALETAFVDFSFISDDSNENHSGCSCNPVSTTVCSCNKVKVACTCVGFSSCSCNSHSSGGGRIVTGCRCAPVH
jgi:hypothetical protein